MRYMKHTGTPASIAKARRLHASAPHHNALRYSPGNVSVKPSIERLTMSHTVNGKSFRKGWPSNPLESCQQEGKICMENVHTVICKNSPS